MAGFWGCGSRELSAVSHVLPVTVTSCTADGRDLSFADTLTGVDGAGASDCATVHYADPNRRLPLTADPSQPEDALTVATDNGLANGDYVVVADCQNADLFQISNDLGAADPDSSGSIEHGLTLSTLYSAGGSGGGAVFPIRTVKFFIQNDPDNDNEPTLYRRFNGVSEALVAGVEHMRLLYGEDTDDDNYADQYVDITAVGNMDNVVSIQSALLFRSQDDQVKSAVDSASYDLLGRTVDPPDDRRLRSLVVNNWSLRNRLP